MLRAGVSWIPEKLDIYWAAETDVSWSPQRLVSPRSPEKLVVPWGPYRPMFLEPQRPVIPWKPEGLEIYWRAEGLVLLEAGELLVTPGEKAWKAENTPKFQRTLVGS